MADDKKNDSENADQDGTDKDRIDKDRPDGTEPAEAATAAETQPADPEGPANGPGEEADGVLEAERMSDLDTDAVIEAFGGIRPMASKLDVAVSTVQGWKTRGHIPENRWRDIIAAAGAHGVDLSAAMPADGSGETSEPTGTASPWGSDTDEDRDGRDPVDAETYATDNDRSDTWDATTDADDDASRRGTAAAAATAPAAAAASARPRRGGGLALLVGLIALAAVIARPLWAPYVDPHIAQLAPPLPPAASDDSTDAGSGGADVGALRSDFAALRDRLAELEARPSVPVSDGDGAIPALPADLDQRLSTLESELAAARAAAEEMQSLNAETRSALEETRSTLAAMTERDEKTRVRLVERLGVLEGRVDQIAAEAERAASGIAGLRQRIEDQSDEIAALEARPAIAGAAQAGIALAVGDVESALTSGRPFAGAINRLIGLAGPDGAVTEAARALAPQAAAGVPTEAALLSRFQEAAPAMQSELGQGGDDLLETLARSAQSLISIRRKGEAPNDPPVSRAEAALERGDLASAVAALAPVRDRSVAVADWLSAAEARLAAEAALADLRAAAADRISGGGASPDEAAGKIDNAGAQDEDAS
jgi:hypothetical protein